MRSAVTLRDVVGETQRVLMETVGPGHGQLDRDVVAGRRQGDRVVKRGPRTVQPVDEGGQPAIEEEFRNLAVGAALVGKLDSDAGIQEGQLAKTMLQRGEIEHRAGKGLVRGQEGDMRSGHLAGIPTSASAALGLAMAEPDIMLAPVAIDRQIEPCRQRIHHRDTDTVEATRHLVGIIVELSAGMKLRHDHFGGGDTFLGMNLDRDAAPIVGHGDRPVGIQDHLDNVAMAGKRLVDGVVHHLVDHMVKPRPVIRIADIHAGALAHRIQTLSEP